jgi:hypothetical protein
MDLVLLPRLAVLEKRSAKLREWNVSGAKRRGQLCGVYQRGRCKNMENVFL